MRRSWHSLALFAATGLLIQAPAAWAADPPKNAKPMPPGAKAAGKPPSGGQFGTLSPNAAGRPAPGAAAQPGQPPNGQRSAAPPQRPASGPATTAGKQPEVNREPAKAAAAAPAKQLPRVEDALAFHPVQKDVDYDRPADAQQCTLQAEEGGTGWTVRDAGGQLLRQFADTNADNVVDQWAYFKDGLEVYRDLDTNHNGKVDQSRWFNTAGTRWGIDRDENGSIEQWRVISAEEATAEVVAAIRDRDVPRFERLLLSPNELKGLGTGPELTAALNDRLSGAAKAFRAYLASQSAVSESTRWVYFGGSRPGVVPAGTKKSTADLMVYENVAAMVETDGKPAQVLVGAMVRVGEAWRLVDAPPADPEKFAEAHVFFPAPELPSGQTPANLTAGEPSEAERKLMADIEKIEADLAQTQDPAAQTPLHVRHADLLEKLAHEAASPQSRAQWLRQLIDTVNAAVQMGGYPAGVDRLHKLAARLASRPEDAELASHAVYGAILGAYTLSIQRPDGEDFAKLQQQWIENLEKFVTDYPNSPDAADAMFQIAQAQESSLAEDEARKWYTRLARSGDSPFQRKAEGALRRLDCVGHPIKLSGPDLQGRTISLDSAEYKGKMVLIHYWSSSYSACKRDLPQIKELLEKYGPLGFAVIGVSLDNQADELQEFLSENRVPWPQIHEAGGMESRLANEMGIISLPTMILIDAKGRVLNRNLRSGSDELELELKGQLKPQVAKNRK